MNTSSKRTNLPTVSVIGPCRNENEFIKDAIHSILANDYPENLVEILVVDGMSTDGTRKKVLEIMANHPRVRLIDNPNRIVPTAMNLGIREATGEFIIRIDCHAEFSNDYIRNCVEVSQRTGAGNVGGYWQTHPGANTSIARAIVLATTSPFGVGNAAFRTSGGLEKEADTVPFGTFRKTLFAEIGPYDDRLVRNQDIELNSRIRAAGQKIIISPQIKLKYFNRATLTGIWQQSYNNGLWNPYTIWLTGGSLRVRHFIPLLFVLGLLGLASCSMLHEKCIPFLTGYTLLYMGCALMAAARQNPAENKTNLFLVVASFLTLHFAYGLGSLWGILSTPIRYPSRGSRGVGKPLADRRK